MSIQAPVISVVVGAYNAEHCLKRSVGSLLSQDGVDFEVIAINDGSTDRTGALLGEIARGDSRVQIIDKPVNEGLTRALIDGCAVARGEFIARHDADDLSLPGRLAAQLGFMERHPEAVMSSCGTRFVGPGGEELFCAVLEGSEIHERLLREDPSRLCGPCHGSTLFRRDAYLRAGGYRPEFRVAQDLDLWVRMSEIGECLGMAQILYENRWREGSISHLLRDLQVRAQETIVESRRRRRLGEDDGPLLGEFAAEVDETRRRNRGRRISGRERAGFSYFVGSTLSGRDDRAARGYLVEAIRRWPLHWRAWVRWSLCSLRLLRAGR